MFNSILLAVVLFAFSQTSDEIIDTKSEVQVKFMYVVDGDTGGGKIEEWVKDAVNMDELCKDRAVHILPMTPWISLSPEVKRVFTSGSGGFYVDGKAIEKDGDFEIDIDGCNGFAIEKNVDLAAGKKKVFALPGTEGEIFVAVQTVSKKQK